MEKTKLTSLWWRSTARDHWRLCRARRLYHSHVFKSKRLADYDVDDNMWKYPNDAPYTLFKVMWPIKNVRKMCILTLSSRQLEDIVIFVENDIGPHNERK